MSEILDRLENAVREVEEQLLAEFDRIRKTLSGEAYSTIDPGVKTALDSIVMGLWHDLEHSGDRNNLTLRTERHENLSTRMIVLKKLLDARIPTAFLAEAEEQFARTRRSVAVESTPKSDVPKSRVTAEEKKGLFDSFRGMFGNKSESGTANRIKVTERAPTKTERVGVYAEGGIYATAQQLASIAERFQTKGDEKDMMNAAVSGKAIFDSRELSSTGIPVVTSTKKATSPDEIRRKLEQSGASGSRGASSFESRELSTAKAEARDLAQTPEAIRKKLENAARTSGASRFESRELSNPGAPPSPPPARRAPVEKSTQATDKQEVAQTPQEIRRKLEAREKAANPTGRASFGSKDIEPIVPQDIPRRKEKPQEEKVAERPSGKAIFESKDLSPSDKK